MLRGIYMEQFLQVGAITSTHGLKGEVKVFPTTDDPTRFEDLDEVILETARQGRISLEIENVRYFKQMVILKFRGLDRIEDVEPYKKATLWVDREHALPLEENENYIADLIGMPVITDEGETLGTLRDVLQTGANDVYVVQTGEGRELLLPAIRECVLDVDLEQNRILVHLMEGLLDL